MLGKYRYAYYLLYAACVTLILNLRTNLFQLGGDIFLADFALFVGLKPNIILFLHNSA